MLRVAEGCCAVWVLALTIAVADWLRVNWRSLIDWWKHG